MATPIRTKPTPRKKPGVITVDFTGVSSGGNYNIPDGDYVAEVTNVEEKVSKNQKPFVAFELTLRGDEEGKKVFHNCSLQPQALFNLRRTLEALGMEIPDSVMEIDLQELKGMYLGVHIEGEEYQGKTRPRVTDVFSVTEEDGDI